MTHGRPDAWNKAELFPPRAHGTPLSAAELKAAPEDFRVEEQLSFVPSGSGPHLLLRVEKKSANTRWVAAEIARVAKLPVHDVGYAGLKDRHATGAPGGAPGGHWCMMLRLERPRELEILWSKVNLNLSWAIRQIATIPRN